MSSSEKNLAIVVPAYNEEAGILPTLESLYGQTYNKGVLNVIVNNASTDNTAEVVNRFDHDHPDFPLVIIDEYEKGTGAAADTGFHFAIDLGYPIIARTDADTRPRQNWSRALMQRFASSPEAQLIGGKRHPRTDDEWFRLRDKILWPSSVALSRCIAWGDKGAGKITGANLATAAEAYVNTGGFPRTAIEDADEDHVYIDRVMKLYGKESVLFDPNLHVDTSMRRLRDLGYIGFALYRLRPNARTANGHEVDIRTEYPGDVEVGTLPSPFDVSAA